MATQFLVSAVLIVILLVFITLAQCEVHYHDFIVKEVNFTRLCESKLMLVVNESYPGPAIRARKGDTIYVNVYNQGYYGFTIHWHGVKQPRNPWFDGPEYVTQCPILPGTNFTYQVQLSTEEGTLWWHAHSDWTRASVHGAIVVLPAQETEQVPINPYGKAKKMAEDIILDFSKNSNMAVMILRYFNVIGSDPEGRLGEAPRPDLREQGRISGACFDAARGIISGLKVRGIDYVTPDGTCVRDYIDVTDLVDAHVKALANAQPRKVGIYNVGTGKGSSVKEFVEACKKATGADIKVEYLGRRPGDYAEVYSDPSKIRDELNWTAQHTDLQQSLQTAWRWQKKHFNGYGTLNTMA